MRLRNLRGTGVPYILFGIGTAAAADRVLSSTPDASRREVEALAGKKGVGIEFRELSTSGAYLEEVLAPTRDGRFAVLERRVVMPKSPSGKYDVASLAHELGHIEGWGGSGPYSLSKILHKRFHEPVFMVSAAAAGAVRSPRARKALLLGMVPHVAEEALASYRGARILRKEGKLKKRHVVRLTIPVVDRAAGAAILYGAGKGSRALFEYVRGHVRRQNGKRINVSSYFRRIRRL